MLQKLHANSLLRRVGIRLSRNHVFRIGPKYSTFSGTEMSLVPEQCTGKVEN